MFKSQPKELKKLKQAAHNAMYEYMVADMYSRLSAANLKEIREQHEAEGEDVSHMTKEDWARRFVYEGLECGDSCREMLFAFDDMSDFVEM